MRTLQDLKQMQELPLDVKVRLTQSRIRQWVNEYGKDGVYISFSGGKDSTVLLHIVRDMYPDIPAVFIDTGLEYPEIRDFVKTFDNVTIVKPAKNFKEVIKTCGYPFISKELSAIIGGAQKAIKILENECVNTENSEMVIQECKNRFKKVPGEWRHLAQTVGYITRNNEFVTEFQENVNSQYGTVPKKYKFLLHAPFQLSDRCCKYLKKEPVRRYAKASGRNAITAQMASESRLRTQQWIRSGCNMFDTKIKMSNPMAFWNETDVLQYVVENNLKICSVYGDIVFDNGKYKTTGCERTGCMFCGFGCQHEKKGEGRFVKLKQTHPKQYEWIMKPVSDGGLGYKEILDYMNENGLHIEY